jgi:hypothetical protein
MAVRGISRGSGITKRVVPALSGDMRAADMGQTLLYTAGGGSFEGWIREPEAMARTILQGAGHDPDRPGSVAAEDDTPVDYSARILRLIQIVRGAIKRGNAEEAARFSLQIGWLACEHDFKVDWEKPAWRAFIEGPKRDRSDALGRLIDKALGGRKGRKASFAEVLGHLRAEQGNGIVQEIDEDEEKIYWRWQGRERTTTFKSLRNRLAKRRKKVCPLFDKAG